MKTLFLMALVIGLPIAILVTFYNGFVTRRNTMRQAFSGIDIQLRRRWDLIPNLVATVKTFARHEEDTFARITKARERASTLPADGSQRAIQERRISEGMKKLLAIAEDYPELQSSEHFLELQQTLTEIESEISTSRKNYNATVLAWNNAVETMPGSLLAKLWGFQTADWFEIQAQERTTVDIAVES